MRRASRDLAALALFSTVTLLVFGLPVLANPGSTCLCAPYSGDPALFMWSLQWWPHALAETTNPLFTHAVWAPSGTSLAWATTVPSAALLAFPVLAAAGPVVAYNALMLLAPVLAAYGAFRLCLYLTRSFWPALVGGYVFGFSTYVLGHLLGHLNLVSIWPIPLEALVVLQHVEGRLSRRRLLLLLVPLALVQF